MAYIGNGPYNGVLTGGNIQDGTVDTADITNDAVTTVKIADGAVTAGKLAAGAAVPSQSGQAGKYLTTDGTNSSWGTVNTDLVSDTSPQLGGNLDLNSNNITGTGGINITGSLDVNGNDIATFQSSSATPVELISTNANSSRVLLQNTSSGVDYSYFQATTDNGSGYLIHNGTGAGNSLASGETYIWSSGGKVSLVPNGTIGNKLEVDTNGDVTINGKMFGGGLVLLGQSTWTTDTTGAIFDVFDYTKYSNYLLTWVVDHGPNWEHTYFRFRNSSGDISTASAYNGVTSWYGSSQSGSYPTWNSTSGYGGSQSHIWMAGNGTAYASQGMAIISIPHNGAFSRASIRGDSQLIYTTSTTHYLEQFSGSLTLSNPHTAITGCHIYGSGGNSRYGSFEIFGIERG